MKLREQGVRQRKIKTGEVLETLVKEPVTFDIHRDVRDKDWRRIGEVFAHQLESTGIPYDVDLEAAQILVLGENNKAPVNVDRLCEVGLAEAKFNFKKRSTKFEVTHNIGSMGESLVHWLMIAPQDKQQILSTVLTPELQDRMWRSLDTSFMLPLSLLLLFPERRDRIKQKCDLEKIKDWLRQFLLKGGDRSQDFSAALLLSLLYPNEGQDLVTPELVSGIRSASFSSEALTQISVAYLLSAREVILDEQGKINVIENQTTGKHLAAPLPTRHQVA